ncbi:multidrug ABC transporter ATP-binding protein, partial [Klebsiella pneumoniae]|nr:multidrug ABC transporter ATP-binding protein [Klebsiella pneumoniae]
MGIIRRYMEFVKPYKWKIILTVLIGIIKFSIPLVIPLLLKYVVDDIIQGTGTAQEKTSSLFTVMAVVFAVYLVLRPPVEYYRQYFA